MKRKARDPKSSDYDLSTAKELPAKRRGRAIVSVPFERDDFEALSHAVERSGESLSGYIRKATMERIHPSGNKIIWTWPTTSVSSTTRWTSAGAAAYYDLSSANPSPHQRF